MKLYLHIKQNKLWMKFFYRWMLIALIVHLIAAIFSAGFHHFDEHFQILEFLNLKLGGTQAKNLPWEFHEKMRPWSQPGLYFLLTKLMVFLGITDTHTWALVFRIFSSLFGWFSLVLMGMMSYIWFYNNSERINRWQKTALYLLALIWFIPFIHARPSSDNMGAVIFVIACFTILLSYPMDYYFNNESYSSLKMNWSSNRFSIPRWLVFLVGLLFGFSFQFRHQMGVPILFFYLWCLFYGRMSIKSGLIMTFALILSLGFGVIIDYWGYGSISFPVWNYLYQGAVVGHAGKVLPNPWWDYFRLTILRGMPPLSIVFVLGTLLFWFKRPSHPLTWMTFPLFIIHTSFLHKELRYIFLVILLAPIMTLLALKSLNYFDDDFKFLKNKFIKPIAYFLISMNIVLLIITSFKPANVSAKFYQYLGSRTDEITMLYHKGENPLTMVGHPLNFYWPKGLETSEVSDFEQLDNMIKKEFGTFWFVTTKGKDYFAMLKRSECALNFITYPRWILKFNIGRWVERSRIWALFQCHSKN